jgi:hypothetical protein
VDQLERPEGVEPGVHLPGKLAGITALPERMLERLAGFHFFQACLQNTQPGACDRITGVVF